MMAMSKSSPGVVRHLTCLRCANDPIPEKAHFSRVRITSRSTNSGFIT
jgi:hypothetical protein